jgi:predicted small metal-binding protein
MEDSESGPTEVIREIEEEESEEELLKKAAEHAVNDHGYKEEEIMTPEMQQDIRSHIMRV